MDFGGVVKTMLDGVVEAHTAAMLTPYSDDPAQTGKLFWEPEKYKRAVTELDRRGLQIFTHAIGDRAVRLSLDAYEEAEKSNQTHDTRPRIEHIETISAQIFRGSASLPWWQASSPCMLIRMKTH